MSECVVRMEMPLNCLECPFCGAMMEAQDGK